MHPKFAVQTRKNSGFSLVELSIVLVILGLLVGGVLVGQTLIKSAELRAQMKQIENFKTGVNTFRMRFSALPGDFSNATRSFLPAEWPLIVDGNGNEKIGDANGAYDDLSGEITQFWMQLGAAGVIEGTYNTTSNINAGFPETALGRNGIIAIYDATIMKNNILYIGVKSAADPGTDDSIVGGDSLTPVEAAAIDEKFDDGHPYFGKAQARAETGSTYNIKPDYLDPTAYLLNRLPVYAQTISNIFIRSAHADDEVTAIAEACVIMDILGSTAASEEAAYYATTNDQPACQMAILLE